MRRILWNAQVIRPDQRAFGWDHIVNVIIFQHNLTNVAGPFNGDVDLSRQQQILTVIFSDGFESGFLFDQQIHSGVDFFRRIGVHAGAQIHRCHADHGRAFRQDRDAAGIFVAFENVTPTGDAIRGFAFTNAQAHCAPHIGHGMLVTGVIGGVPEGGCDIL